MAETLSRGMAEVVGGPRHQIDDRERDDVVAVIAHPRTPGTRATGVRPAAERTIVAIALGL